MPLNIQDSHVYRRATQGTGAIRIRSSVRCRTIRGAQATDKMRNPRTVHSQCNCRLTGKWKCNRQCASISHFTVCHVQARTCTRARGLKTRTRAPHFTKFAYSPQCGVQFGPRRGIHSSCACFSERVQLCLSRHNRVGSGRVERSVFTAHARPLCLWATMESRGGTVLVMGTIAICRQRRGVLSFGAHARAEGGECSRTCWPHATPFAATARVVACTPALSPRL